MKKHLFYLLLLLPFLGFGQDWEQAQKIVASDRGFNDHFGYSVAIDGDYAIVGASYNKLDQNGENSLNSAGAAYIFKKEGNVWTQQQKIVAPQRGDSDFFGASVAISGDYVIVGAFQEDEDANEENTISGAGSAYIFKRDGGNWALQQKIAAPVRGISDFFGYTVAIDGDYVVVGAYQEDEDINEENTLNQAGSAYIFRRDGDNWIQQQKIVSSDRAAFDNFGKSVAVDGEYIVVTATAEDEDANGENTLSNAGSAYIFKKDGSSWVQQQKIVASDRNAADGFGKSVAIDGENIVVTAVGEDEDENGENSLNGAGSAYIFKRSGDVWAQQQKIVASDRDTSDSFGYSVSIDGNYIVVGANLEDDDINGENTLNNAGSAYIFKRSGDTWTQQQKITASDRGENDNFGFYVAVYGNYVLIGAYNESEDENGENTVTTAGSAYIFQLDCSYVTLSVDNPSPICSGNSITLNADSESNIYWYDSADGTEPIFAGGEFETPVLTETTTYWVEAIDDICTSERIEVEVIVNPTPELTVENTGVDTCEGTSATLTATSDGTVNWYDSEDATEPIFTGTSYETPELTETTSYWVEAISAEGCISERVKVMVTVLPAPELIINETEVEICVGNNASFFAESPGNIIFWYANEDDTEYLSHGNNFITEELTETTTYWVEAYNIETGCRSQRVEVTATVSPYTELTVETTEAEICAGTTATLIATSSSTINWYDSEDGTIPIFTGSEFTTPELFETTSYWVEASGSGECASERVEIVVMVHQTPAPVAVHVQEFEEGETLADLEVEAEGTLTWYADGALTTELPETTPLVDDTTYWVTQTIDGCESQATDITVDEMLGTTDVNEAGFAYYPNPVKDKLYFNGNEKIQSVQVFDMSGRLVLTEQSIGMIQLNVTTLQKGIYLVRVQTDKQLKVFKIVKE